MATKKVIALEAKLEGGQQVGQTVGNIKKELREANLELIAAQKNFGEYSAEAINAAKKVAQLKDSIQEARETADLFDPGKKFQAFTGALNAAAGGFAAVQGAQALLGAESEDLQKTLAKVQGALALSQGLSAITDSAKDFQRLGAVIKGPVVAAFTTLKGALAATGIGLLVVAIGALIGNFEKVKQVVMNAVPGLATFAKTIGNIITAVTDFVGITSEAERALDKLKKANERLNEDSETRIRILQAQGGKEREIFEERAAQYDRELDFLRRRLKETGKLSDEELKKFRELSNDKAVLFTEEQARLNKIQQDNAKKAADDSKKQADDRVAKEKAANEKIIAERKALIEKQKALALELDNFLFNRTATSLEQQLRVIQQNYDKRLAIAKGNADLTTQVELARVREEQDALNKFAPPEAIRTQQIIDETNKQTQIKIDGANLATAGVLAAAKAETDGALENSEARRKIDWEEVNAKIEATQFALNTISQVLNQQSAAGKAVAVAQSLINTYQGATKALAQGGIFGFASAAAVIAAGIINVKKIISTKIPGEKGSSSASASASAPTTQAPVAPQLATTRLDQQSIDAVGNAASRAFVLETDVSSNQERIRRLNRAARIN